MIGIVAIALALVVLLVGLDFLARPRRHVRYRERRRYYRDTSPPSPHPDAAPDAALDHQVRDRAPQRDHARVRR